MELKLDGNSEIGVHVMSDILFGNESGRKFEISFQVRRVMVTI